MSWEARIMKSKTSFCNAAVLRTDFTRFTPVWLLYTVVLASTFLIVLGNVETAYNAAFGIRTVLMPATAVFQFLYALVTAQALFGYLFDTRLCCGLHALPMTRGCHFRTHVLSGLLFSLLPGLAVMAVSLPVVRDGWSASVWWFLASTGQYLFFFGLATVCCFCAGNRTGSVLCYGLGNLLPLLIYWVADDLFRSLMYGVRIPEEPFLLLCPLFQFLTKQLLTVTYVGTGMTDSGVWRPVLDQVLPNTQAFVYLGICAGLGAALLLASYLMYRRRQLERAGELLALKPLMPVFLLLFTLGAGCFFRLLFGIFTVMVIDSYLPLLAGMVVGYFGCRMLLERSVKVFRWSALPPLAAMVAVLLLSLCLTSLDAFGVTRRIPETEDIAAASLTTISEYGRGITVTDPEAIGGLQEIHRARVDAWKTWRESQGAGRLLAPTKDLSRGEARVLPITLRYTLTSGSVLERHYNVPVALPDKAPQEAAVVDGETAEVPAAEYTLTREGQLLKEYLSTTENVLGVPEDQLSALAIRLTFVGFYYNPANNAANSATSATGIQSLLEAVAQDCRAGAVLPHCYLSDTDNYLGTIFFTEQDQNREIPVYESMENTVRCLKEQGLLPEE